MRDARGAVRRLVGLLSVVGVTVALTMVTGGSAEAAVTLWEIQRPDPFTPKCLDIKTEDPPSNALVQEWHCSGGDEQHFEVFAAVSPGLVEIVDKRNQNCLTVPSPNELTLGADLRMTPCTLRPNQLWKLDHLFGSTYFIEQYGSNMCVDVRGGNWGDGTHIQQWTCNGSNAQQWQFLS